jgi:hypothetical protein
MLFMIQFWIDLSLFEEKNIIAFNYTTSKQIWTAVVDEICPSKFDSWFVVQWTFTILLMQFMFSAVDIYLIMKLLVIQ